jgi:Circularly permutated YpsA SLOG family
MPLHFMTENGTDSSLGRLYGAKAMPTGNYAARTARNVRESDGTLWFGTTDTPGAKTTLEVCELWRKPMMIIEPHRSILPSDVVQWPCQDPQIKRLNIAGNRESKNPGIGERVERFLIVVFKRLAEDRTPEVSF